MAQIFLPLTTSATPNTPESISSKIIAAGYTGFLGLAELDIVNDASQPGNLVVTSKSNATGESDGTAAQDFSFTSGGSVSDTIDPTSLYVISATASKKFSVYARSKV